MTALILHRWEGFLNSVDVEPAVYSESRKELELARGLDDALNLGAILQPVDLLGDILPALESLGLLLLVALHLFVLKLEVRLLFFISHLMLPLVSQ